MNKEFHYKLQNIGWKIIDDTFSQLEIGMTEKDGVEVLGNVFKKYDINKIWHPSCIKFDESTLKCGVKHAPTDIKLKHIALIDIGIVVDNIEVDCGRTKAYEQRFSDLANNAEAIFTLVSEDILNQKISPSQTYKNICKYAEKFKLKQIAPTGGHALGPYPTPKKEPKIKVDEPLNHFTSGGWMIEVHVSDGTYGAFYENLIWIN